MAELHVRNLPPEVHLWLRQRAAAQGRSMSAETVAILRAALPGAQSGAGRNQAIEELRAIRLRTRADTYGERIAPIYDQRYPDVATGQVELLAELAGTGQVLELGIGTGRLALPLAARGVRVHGIDASPAMVDRLRAKPGSDEVTVTITDFADFDLPERFSLVFVVFNTFFNLPSQQAQVACFRAVARHLTPGGRFLVEAFVPDLGRFDRGQRVHLQQVELDRVELDCSVHDPVAQRVNAQHVTLSPGGIQCYPVELRYAWPSELDLMAALAGLESETRWGSWDRRPFDSGSGSHISVWRVPATPEAQAASFVLAGHRPA